MSFEIDGHRVGPGAPCFVTAEIGLAHEGSLGSAHAYIDAVAEAGATAIKFQTHIAEAESTAQEPFRVAFSEQDESRYAYWERTAFSREGWRSLADHARDRGLVFLSAPFSFEAVDLLSDLKMAAWKVGSGEVTNWPLLKRMAETGRPVLLSSGCSSWADLDHAVQIIHQEGAPVAVYQCTTAYPCSLDRIGLNVLGELRERYDCPVGLSDHSGHIYAGLAAAVMGANLVEVHVVFSRDCFGPDTVASVTTAELADLVEGIQSIETMMAHPVDKDAVAVDLAELRTIFGKSVVAARDLPAGHQLGRDDITLKKPGTGIPAAQLESVCGKRLTKLVTENTIITEDDLA